MKPYTVRTVGVFAVVALAAFCLGAAEGDRIIDGALRILGADKKPITSFEQTGDAKIGKDLTVGGKLSLKDTDVLAAIKKLQVDTANLAKSGPQIRVMSGEHGVSGNGFGEFKEGGGVFGKSPVWKYVSDRIPFAQPFKNPPNVFLTRMRDDIDFKGNNRLFAEYLPVDVNNTGFRIQITILQPMSMTANMGIRWLAIGE